MPKLEDITEDDLKDMFDNNDFFFRKVYTKSPPLLKIITDTFSIYGEINYEQSFIKETKEDFIIFIAFESEQGFNKSKEFISSDELRINPSDNYSKTNEINTFYRIVALIPNTPIPTITEIKEAFDPSDHVEKISIKESKLIAVIYLKSKDTFIKYIPGDPIPLKNGSLRTIPSLAISNDPNLTRILINNLPFKTNQLKILAFWEKIKIKKKLQSSPLYGGVIRTAKNVPVKRIFFWFNTTTEIKELDDSTIKILDSTARFSIE